MAKLLPFLPLFDQPGQLDPPNRTLEFGDPKSVPAQQPPDAVARAEALNIRRSFIVEAPAGSGKTGLLIQRYLKLLADESVTTPEQVLAITFTRKATAEMRDRVLGHLLAAASVDTPAVQPTVLFQLAAAGESVPPTDSFHQETIALSRSVLERDHLLGWSLLEHPQRLNIRTIDSICAEIARALPMLSGSGGRLTPVEDAEPLHREAARRTLLQMGSGDVDLDSALRTLLLQRHGNLAGCEDLLADMVSLRDQWGDLIPLNRAHLDETWLDGNVLPKLERALDRAICATLTDIAHAFPPDLLAELSEIAAEMGHADGYDGGINPIAFCKGRSESPEAIAEHLDQWRSLIHLLLKPSSPKDWRKSVSRNVIKFEIEKRHEAQLKAIIAQLSDVPSLFDLLCEADSLPPAHYPADQWKIVKALLRVLSHALAELQLVFAERNQCDFTELGLLARHALTQDSGADDLAAALGARLQHLLVDEMQDTSTSQYALLELLTESWDGHSQTVFLVGDPRQSIYLFRQARVERFVRAMTSQHLGDLPLAPLRLTANFRSQRTLVDQFNADFPLVFAGEDRGPEANALPYEPAHATLPASTSAEGIVWHINPVPSARAQEDSPSPLTSAQLRQQQARRDAREIARIARQWLAKPLPPGRRMINDDSGNIVPKPWRIAVLVRSRNHLTEIVAAFKKDDAIPYRAVDIETLNERQEVLDLTALTRTLLHPADRVALLAVLRAPWCGLTLADLHTLTGSDDATLKEQSIQRLIAERGHLLPEDAILRLTRVWNVLHSLATLRASLTASQLVERAWRSLGGDAWLEPAQLANAHRFFELLETLEAEAPDGRIDAAVLRHRLQRLYAEPEPISSGSPFVELLTIHKAKGIEWDIVFVPALERQPAVGMPRLLTWCEIGLPDDDDNAAHIMLAPIRGVGEERQPLNRWLYQLNKAREAAEDKRLFYVACTRAREELHLFAAPEVSVKGTLGQGRATLLKAAWPAAYPHIARLPGAITEARATEEDGEDSDQHAAAFSPPPEPLTLDLADATWGYHATIERLPPTFDSRHRFTAARSQRLAYANVKAAADSVDAFARPEGSFAARSFGNVVHAFLEMAAALLSSGATVDALVAELPSWTPRITALLRADGLGPNAIIQLTGEALAALQNALRDPDGRWLLSPHYGAASELGVAAWLDLPGAPARSASIRVDRVFRAGTEPQGPGGDVLWIVDYKTANHGRSGLDEFLVAQRAIYTAQLETYAQVLAQVSAASERPPREFRVALYYPTIPRLIWWKPAASQSTTSN